MARNTYDCDFPSSGQKPLAEFIEAAIVAEPSCFINPRVYRDEVIFGLLVIPPSFVEPLLNLYANLLQARRTLSFDLRGRELGLSQFGRPAFGQNDLLAGFDVRHNGCGAHAALPSRLRSQACTLARR
jgi:hypothetical protein